MGTQFRQNARRHANNSGIGDIEKTGAMNRNYLTSSKKPVRLIVLDISNGRESEVIRLGPCFLVTKKDCSTTERVFKIGHPF